MEYTVRRVVRSAVKIHDGGTGPESTRGTALTRQGRLPAPVMFLQRLKGGKGGRYVISGEQREMEHALRKRVPGVQDTAEAPGSEIQGTVKARQGRATHGGGSVSGGVC